MTANRIFVVMKKYGKAIPKERAYLLEERLRYVPNEWLDEIMFCVPIKSKIATVLFSIFLGGVAVDRFYIGDGKGAGLKLSLRILALIFSWVPVLGWVLNISSSIFCIVDIFLTYRIAKQQNLNNLLALLRRKEREVVEASVI